MRGSTAVLAALLAATLTACAAPSAASHRGKVPDAAAINDVTSPPSAEPVAADPRVGAVFVGTGPVHTCTATVLHSTGGDLILTAAHCLVDGLDATFVPGYDAADVPDDPWHLDDVYLDPRWVDDQDPRADYAIVRVSRAAGGSPETDADGGLTLGVAPPPGTPVTVTGYSMGVGGGPIGCHGATALGVGGFPELACAGLVAGVSGAPWIAGRKVTGLVGGLDGGGCDEDISYSPPFDGRIETLLARAEAGGPPDTAPDDVDDGC